MPDLHGWNHGPTSTGWSSGDSFRAKESKSQTGWVSKYPDSNGWKYTELQRDTIKDKVKEVHIR